MGKRKDLITEAMDINKKTKDDYAYRLKLLATSLFTWEGLDEVCGFGASNFLEEALFTKGIACFIKDKELGYMVTNCNPTDKLNTYNLPTKVNAWSIAYHQIFDLDDVVLIMNNKMRQPTSSTIDLVAYRLYDTQRTIDININSQKTPVLLEGDDKSILSLENVYNQYSGNSPVLFPNKQFDINTRINAVTTDAPFVADKLVAYKHELWNETLTFLGIDNANTDKKERLITDEVESNNQLINYYLNCFYSTRKQAEELINSKFFGGEEKVKLKINKNLVDLLDLDEKEILGEEDGSVYNND